MCGTMAFQRSLDPASLLLQHSQSTARRIMGLRPLTYPESELCSVLAIVGHHHTSGQDRNLARRPQIPGAQRTNDPCHHPEF